MKDPAWYRSWFDGPYLDLYGHRDAAEAERGTGVILEPLGLAGRRVLDLACGSGRWLRAVEARRAHVVGLDLAWRLLQAARAAPGGATAMLVRADMRALPFLPASFDIVLSMFTSFGYFASPDQDRDVLVEMGRVLVPGGTLVLDFLNAVRVRREVPAELVRQVGKWTVRETRRLDSTGERVCKEMELQCGDERGIYREEVRLWDEAQLVAALAGVGCEVMARYGDYDGSAFDPQQSPRLVLCARRSLA
jgi:SAM-dependent methyltransferase